MDWKLSEQEQELVVKNLKLVKKIVRQKFSGVSCVDYEDIVQIGNVALMSSAHFFIKRNITVCNFCTFAWPRISSYISSKLSFKRVSKILARKINSFRNSAYQHTGKHISDEELASLFGLTTLQLRRIEAENEGAQSFVDLNLREELAEQIFDDRLSSLDLLILKENHELKIFESIEKYERLKMKIANCKD